MREVTFRSSDGLKLEGVLDVPDDARAALLICHAHPGMQGTMNSPLLIALRDEAVTRGLAVLRFNFRGVGASEGEVGTGIAEVADAAGAVAKLRDEVPGVPTAACGWSFGAAIALRLAAEGEDLTCCTAIAPATEEKPGITAGLPRPAELDLTLPVLVVVGSNDTHTPPDRCKTWAAAAGARYLEIKAANHFFWGRYEPVVAAVVDFVAEQTMGKPGSASD